eukprot:COSAG06_NODE_5_length_38423_cov_121.612645_25_plen_155_part_00
MLGFPANQYMDQEPNSNADIKKFASGPGKHDCGCPLFGHRNKGCALPGPYCNWQGQAVPPLKLFAKTNVKAPWCTGSPATDCTPQSKECCATNQAVWQWLEKADPSSYPPAWNWAGKHLFDKCGKLRKSVSKESASVKSLAPDITKLLAETPMC